MATDVISGIVNDKQDITNQLGPIAETTPVLKTFTSILRPKSVVTKINSVDTSGAMIWGRDDWGTPTTWGGTTPTTLYTVLPNNNIYVEYFGQSDYIDGTSTGTLDTTAETYSFTTGQIYLSEIICKPRGAINTVLIRSHPDFVNLDVEVSNDGGSTFFTATVGTSYTFSTTTADDELVLKFTATDTQVISEPVFVEINK